MNFPITSSINYLPIPPRLWSRVQSPCSLSIGVGNNFDYATNDYKRQMLLKGNILQYKKNSSDLTKNQRYALIAKGMWTNRTTTWATQSVSYTNPNTTSLKRVNFTIIDPSNNTFSNPLNPFFAYGCSSSEIKDGGSLVCNTVVNPCTDEVISQTKSQIICNPTTDSDVPGPIMELCWNDGTPTWYPRQRYTMGTSGNKWPVNSKEIVSAIHPNPPILLSVTIDSNSVFLEWESGNNDCYPVQEFYIYDNDVIVKKVPFPNLSTDLTDLFNCTNNVFYITAVIYKSQSDPSNSLSAFIDLPYGPTITYYDSTCDGGITLIWEMQEEVCLTIDYYNIYEVGAGIIGTSAATTFNILKTDCKSYSFYVTAVFLGGSESIQSQTVTVTQQPCAPVLSSSNFTNTTVNINWSEPSSTCDILSYDLYKVYNGSTFITNISGPSPYSYLVTNLLQDETYTFFAYSKGLSNNSVKSNTVTVITPPNTLPLAPNITGVTYSYKQATLSWTNVDITVTGYDVYLNGIIQASNITLLSYTYNGLVNGTTQVLGVSAKNSFGNSTVSTTNALLPTTQSYFVVTNEFTQAITASDYIITFTASPGTVLYSGTFNVNCILTLVGGGGGGAAGNINSAGGGGAGGEVVTQQSIVFQPGNTANVTSVGNGGAGGATFGSNGSPGGSSQVVLSSITYTASGGGGGFSSSSSGGTGLGGNGGNGATTTVNSGNGDTGYNGLDGYSGGGGGGSYPLYVNSGTGASPGQNGIGGFGGRGVSTPYNLNGISATTTGSGGGGACGGNSVVTSYGGNGFRGIVIFTIPN